MADKTSKENLDHVKKLVRRYQAAKKIRDMWRPLMQDAYEFGLPQRNLFNDMPEKGGPQGRKKVDRVFDSTAQTATIQFANRIQSDMMPPFHKFIKLQAGPMVPEKFRDEVNKKLEFINDQLFAVMSASNWDTANNETLLDLAVGTGVLFIFEGTEIAEPVMYAPAPIGRVCLEQGAWGNIVGVYVEHYGVKVRDIPFTWEDATIPDSIQKLEDEKKNEDAEVDLIACCCMDQKTKAWSYKVIYEKENAELVDRTYNRQPCAVARWIKVAGEVFGRGPLIQALPDIKTLNKLVELVLRNAALHISGVYTGVSDNVLNPNKVVLRPGAVIPVASNGGTRGPSLKALERTGTFDLAAIVKDDLVNNIKKFLLDRSLPDDSGATPRSATEIIARIRELARDIGSPFGRLVREYIVPVVQSTLVIMERRGLIPKVKVDGLAVQVQVTSPLAQEQNLAEVEAVVRWLEILAALGEEMIALTAKLEDIGPRIGRDLGVPSSLIRSDTEREKLQQIAGVIAKSKIQEMIGQQGQAESVGVNGQLPVAA